MELSEVLSYLESKGNEQTKKIFINHGAPIDGFFGVKVGDMKPIEKKEKNNHQLALDLFSTGNSDAQYLAGLIADPKQFSEEIITKWAKEAKWYMVSEYAVAWNLAETPFCVELCDRWIHGTDDRLKEVAWAALSSYLGIVPNEDVDINFHKKLMEKVKSEIHSAGNRVKYCMNGYLIALGGAIPELTDQCKSAGDEIGKVEVFMGNTACNVPSIRPYIEKMEERGRIGKKKKTAKC